MMYRGDMIDSGTGSEILHSPSREGDEEVHRGRTADIEKKRQPDGKTRKNRVKTCSLSI